MAQSISAGSASVESSLRTVVIMLAGGLLTAMAKWMGDRLGIVIPVTDEMANVVAGLAWVLLSAAYAAVQRKFWPIQTDQPNIYRKDLSPTPLPQDRPPPPVDYGIEQP